MANRLKVGWVHAIEALLERRWSQRRIAEALGIDRGTVARYARLPRQAASLVHAPPDAGEANPAKPAHGSGTVEIHHPAEEGHPAPGMIDLCNPEPAKPAHDSEYAEPVSRIGAVADSRPADPPAGTGPPRRGARPRLPAA